MKERLQQFLDSEDLSPSNFAETIEVQRSGISHLLSGRNKPSLDFIKKVAENFPDLNLEWFITGEGEMYKVDNNLVKDITQSDSLLFTSVKKGEEHIVETEKGRLDHSALREFSRISDHSPKIANLESTPTIGPDIEKLGATALSLENEEIEAVLLLYRDGSFKLFNKRNREL